MIIAIDPGLSGGIAWFCGETGETGCIGMPKTERDIVDSLDNIVRGSHGLWTLYIEKVGGYVGGRGQPGSAMFRFGAITQVPRTWADCRRVRLVEVTPQKWQKEIGCGSSKTYGTKWKAHLKEIAQRLYPYIGVTLLTSDALLILEYAKGQKAAR